jgi:hypothetical protein
LKFEVSLAREGWKEGRKKERKGGKEGKKKKRKSGKKGRKEGCEGLR